MNFESMLAWVGRAIVLTMIFVVPWPYASASWTHQANLIIPCAVAGAIGAAISIRQATTSAFRGLLLTILCFLALGLLQVVPLPMTVWRQVSLISDFEDKIDDQLLDFGYPEEQIAASRKVCPRTVSVSQTHTRAVLCMLSCAALVLVATQNLFCTKGSLLLLYCTIVSAAFLIAAIGLAHSVGLAPPVFNQNASTSFATFFGRNSAPQYLACGIAATIGLFALHGPRKGKTEVVGIVYPPIGVASSIRKILDASVESATSVRVFLAFVFAILTAAVVATNSRGGLIALMAAVLVLSIALVFSRGVVAVWGCLGVAFLGLLSCLSSWVERPSSRIFTVSEELSSADNIRIELWREVFQQSATWNLGTGLGTFHLAVQTAFTRPVGKWFYHAESIYVEVASNAGPLGLVILAVSLILLFCSIFRRRKSRLDSAACLAALFASCHVAINSLTDFSLILPAVWLPFVCLVGAAFGTANGKLLQAGTAGGKVSRRRYRTKSRLREATPRSRVTSVSGGKKRPYYAIFIASSFLIGGVIFNAPSVRGLADAEKMSASSVSSKGDSSCYEGLLADVRFRQQYAAKLLFEQTQWPTEFAENLRLAWSRPELVSAAFANNKSSQMIELRKLFASTEALADLTASFQPARAAEDLCSIDWRVCWAIHRADCGQLTEAERDRNLLKLAVLANCQTGVLLRAGESAAFAGHEAAAVAVLGGLVETSGAARMRCAELCPDLISLNELAKILPADPLVWVLQVECFDRLEKIGLASQLRSRIDWDLGARAYSAANWLKIAEAARDGGEQFVRIEALSEVSLLRPANLKVVEQLVECLVEADDVDKALGELNRGLMIDPKNLTLRKLADRIKEAGSGKLEAYQTE